MRATGLSGLIFVMSACGAASVGTTAEDVSSEADIYGGTVTSGYSAVAMLVNFGESGDYQAVCSATAIGRYTFLTAAHCVLAINASGKESARLANPSNLLFYTGYTMNSFDAGKVFYATDIVLPGGSSFAFATFVARLNNGEINGNDVAVVHVSRPLSIGPLKVASSAPKVGMDLTMVGYGSLRRVGDAGLGTKRFVHTPMTGLFNSYMFVAGNLSKGTCAGDSGGPALNNRVVYGITQAGQVDASSRCAGNDVFTRADTWGAFIRKNIR